MIAMTDGPILDLAPGIHHQFCIGIRYADGGFDRLIEVGTESAAARMLSRIQQAALNSEPRPFVRLNHHD